MLSRCSNFQKTLGKSDSLTDCDKSVITDASLLPYSLAAHFLTWLGRRQFSRLRTLKLPTGIPPKTSLLPKVSEQIIMIYIMNFLLNIFEIPNDSSLKRFLSKDLDC